MIGIYHVFFAPHGPGDRRRDPHAERARAGAGGSLSEVHLADLLGAGLHPPGRSQRPRPRHRRRRDRRLRLPGRGAVGHARAVAWLGAGSPTTSPRRRSTAVRLVAAVDPLRRPGHPLRRGRHRGRRRRRVDEPRGDGLGPDGRRPVRRGRGAPLLPGLVSQGVAAELVAPGGDSLPPRPGLSPRCAASRAGGDRRRERQVRPRDRRDRHSERAVRRRRDDPPRLQHREARRPGDRLPHRRAGRAVPRGRLGGHRGQLLADHRRRQRRTRHVAGPRRRAGPAPARASTRCPWSATTRC